MKTVDLVDHYEKTFLLFREPIQKNRESSKTRLVWFVGIAGFALINGEQIWDAVSNNNFSGKEGYLLSLPWIVTVVFCVLAHIFTDELGVKDERYYFSKLTAIGLYKMKLIENDDNGTEFLLLLNDSHPAYQKELKSVNRLSPYAIWFERLAFISLVFGFVWSWIGPQIL